MKTLGEQWIEEIDGVRHMVKAVKGVEGEKLCTACIFKPRIYPDYSKLRHDTVQTPFRCAYGVLCPIEEGYIIDIGPVNEDGCLPSPWGGYPKIIHEVNQTRIENGEDVHYDNLWCVEIHEPVLVCTDEYLTEQQAIDAWNWRT